MMTARKLRTVAVAGMALAVVATAPAQAAAPPKKVGTSFNVNKGTLGALNANTTASKARSLLGRPDNQDSQGFSGKSSNLTLSYKRYGLSLVFWQGTQGGSPKLSSITMTSPQYRGSGVAVGSTTAQLQRALRVKCYTKSSCEFDRGRGNTTFSIGGGKVRKIVLNL